MTMITVALLATALLTAKTAFGADGKALYDKECAKCHGADGKGESKMGKKMGAKDYSNPEDLGRTDRCERHQGRQRGIQGQGRQGDHEADGGSNRSGCQGDHGLHEDPEEVDAR